MLHAEKHEVGNPVNIIWGDIDPFFVEYGHADVTITKVNGHVDRLFAGLGDGIPVFMSHFDKLVSLPKVSKPRF